MFKKISKILICGAVLFFANAMVVNSALAVGTKIPNKSAIVKKAVQGTKTKRAKKTNINLASFEELLKVKGIGKVKAKAIIDYRAKHRKFKSIKDLLKIECKGINEKWLNKIQKFLSI